MKRSLLSLFSVLLAVMMLCLSSCMKVNITFPQNNNIIGSVTPETTQAVVETLPDVPTEAETLPPAENTTASEITTAAPAQKVPTEMSKAELLSFFNENMNLVKESMPAFERAKLTTVSDIKLSNQAANTLVGFVKGALLSEETETASASKGQSCVEIMTPTGERYVSQLTMNDIKDITLKTEGTNYAVTVTLPDAKNPTKDEGAYAKIFNFITVDDVVKTYAPKVGATVERKNIEVNYSGCYAKAVFSPDGKVVSYDTYVTCVISLKDASIKKVVTINTDVDITLVSETNFTKFSY